MDARVGVKRLLLASLNDSKREYVYYSICVRLSKQNKK